MGRDPFREHVELAEPDPRWAERYAQEAARIEGALAHLRPAVEHIGSTSVPLRAKPIVDIQVVVPDASIAAAVSALKRLGYAHHGQGGVAGREYLPQRPCGEQAINVHVFGDTNPLSAGNRLIRDYLRAHPHAADRYSAVKQQAIEQGCVDLLTYSHAKAEHVAAIREAAYQWSRR